MESDGADRGRERRRGWTTGRAGVVLLLSLALGACAGGPQCAPYARRLTGVPLHGAAAAWWTEAAGRLDRTGTPSPGAILVFRATSRLPDGHVSVVRRVLGPRAITVDQANWEPGRIDHGVPVLDVSARNDWSLVRVWWAPRAGLGLTRYPVFGFIVPRPPARRPDVGIAPDEGGIGTDPAA